MARSASLIWARNDPALATMGTGPVADHRRGHRLDPQAQNNPLQLAQSGAGTPGDSGRQRAALPAQRRRDPREVAPAARALTAAGDGGPVGGKQIQAPLFLNLMDSCVLAAWCFSGRSCRRGGGWRTALAPMCTVRSPDVVRLRRSRWCGAGGGWGRRRR